MPIERRGGQKNRKFGRSGRRPAKARYNLSERWVTNKARRIAKQAKFEEMKRLKKIKRSEQTA